MAVDLFLLFALGMTNIAFTWRLLPEPGRRPRIQVADAGAQHRQLLGSPAFLG